MAKKVTWTVRALNDRKKILKYWINRNKSDRYSIQLDNLIRESVLLICSFPDIGKPTNYNAIRIKIIKDYFIFNEKLEEEIIILTIWDSRRDPGKLKIKK